MTTPIDDAAEKFYAVLQQRQAKEEARVKRLQSKKQNKSRELMPFRHLLRLFQSWGVHVHRTESYTKESWSNLRPVPLDVYESASSASFGEGNSLFLDHPAKLEIAIPDDFRQEKLGVVVIACASVHPASTLLTGPFRKKEDALQALASFLGESMSHALSPPPSAEAMKQQIATIVNGPVASQEK